MGIPWQSSAYLGLGCFHCRGPGLIPGQGTKTPQTTCFRPKKKKDTYMLVEKIKVTRPNYMFPPEHSALKTNIGSK